MNLHHFQAHADQLNVLNLFNLFTFLGVSHGNYNDLHSKKQPQR